MTAEHTTVSIDDLQAFCTEAMIAAGMRPEDAKLSAEVLAANDSWGIHTHGTKQLRGLMDNFRRGRMDTAAEAEVVKDGPSFAVFDGHRSMPVVSSVGAMRTAIEKARQTGIACTVVYNSGHNAGAGYYANMAAEEGMFGMAMTNVDIVMAVTGSKGPVLGTNPIAYASPAGNESPVMLDIATSVVAASKAFACRQLGQPMPEPWLLDRDGVPTTDPSNYPEEGAIVPMAGYKGYGIALMIEILTGLLVGAPYASHLNSWVNDTDDPVNQSHTFIAIDINQFTPIESFKENMDALIGDIKNAPKARGVDRIFLPGEMEWGRREKAEENGIPLPEDVILKLQGLAEDVGVEKPAFLQ
jgi:ureidoglycolate dehydrogenase (NAD+)